MTQFFVDWKRFAPDKLPQPSLSLGRVGVLEFVRGQRPEFVDLSNPAALRDYLDGVYPRAPCRNRLFLLEDLDETNLEMLGAALHIDPVVLADHLFTFHFAQNNTVPHRTLPSLTDPTRSFTLRYYELRETDPYLDEALAYNRQTFARVSRKIERWLDLPPRRKKQDTGVDVVRRNVSFWCDEPSSQHKDGDSSSYPWNGKSTSSTLWWLMILTNGSRPSCRPSNRFTAGGGEEPLLHH